MNTIILYYRACTRRYCTLEDKHVAVELCSSSPRRQCPPHTRKLPGFDFNSRCTPPQASLRNISPQFLSFPIDACQRGGCAPPARPEYHQIGLVLVFHSGRWFDATAHAVEHSSHLVQTKT